MVGRDELVEFLDGYLRTNEFPDKSSNGLQVEGKVEIQKVAFAVDTTLRTIEKAVRDKADMLVVHHGMIWGGLDYVTGIHYKRLKALIENGLNLYAAHLPLDAHPEVGNNVGLLKLLGLEPRGAFGDYKGLSIGFWGEFEEPLPVEEVAGIVSKKLNAGVRTYPFGKRDVRTVGAVSGAGAFALEEAHRKGIDLLITGEFGHADYLTAVDLPQSVLVAGHYATETLGVRALMDVVAERFGVETMFIDDPTGL
ncbi:Nif3-like dinuclear metal center hexameric protein [Thermococcus sp. P6]|uniref:Nif3-like dinuclear metal center hexameric protein n=1 Tax=Thermococcus sp. P6 TaxID=122420 RepID=UPI000B59C992|nr:Nif3-like dinuclear metal center hexameric protein [Thermococcus sp. P6]ASJ10221.1 Nif3-like dinuclear metal center hexameric protein [Thermococcus sp. P6]